MPRLPPTPHSMEANEPCLGRWVHDDASGLEGLVIEVKTGGWRVVLSVDGNSVNRRSGALEYAELSKMLRKNVHSDAVNARLKRAAEKAPDRGRGAKLTNKNLNSNYVGTRTAALPDTVKLEASDGKSVQEQLSDALKANQVKPWKRSSKPTRRLRPRWTFWNQNPPLKQSLEL